MSMTSLNQSSLVFHETRSQEVDDEFSSVAMLTFHDFLAFSLELKGLGL